VPFGKFTLLGRLAHGGMAEVFLAEGPNPRGDPLVCLKLILPAYAAEKTFMSMFIDEAKLTAPLAHPNVIQIDDIGICNGRLFLAMEYIRGQTLAILCQTAMARGQIFPPEVAASAIAQACRGLNHAHEATDPTGRHLGIVHRDVSPQNLMLRDDGVVKVVDFGIAKATTESGTRTQSMKGKVRYMSPEQIHGRHIDRRTDVFAMGATLFELCTGEKLFNGKGEPEIIKQILFEPTPDPRARAPEIPEEVSAIVRRACARKPERRFPTAAELAEELDAFAKTRLRHPPLEVLSRYATDLAGPLPRTREEVFTMQIGEPVTSDVSFYSIPGPTPAPATTRPERHTKVARPGALASGNAGAPEAAAEPLEPDGTADPRVAVHTVHRDRAQTQHLAPDTRADGLARPPRFSPRKAGAGVGAVALLVALALWQIRSPAPVPPYPEAVAVDRSAAAPQAELPIAAGFLTLRTNPWSKVFVGDAPIGDTPLVKHKLEAGSHVLVLKNPRLGGFRYRVDLAPGQELDPGILKLESLERIP
jgi:serine/threonine-protein kinase